MRLGTLQPVHRDHRQVDVEEVAVDAHPRRGPLHITLRNNNQIGRQPVDRPSAVKRVWMSAPTGNHI